MASDSNWHPKPSSCISAPYNRSQKPKEIPLWQAPQLKGLYESALMRKREQSNKCFITKYDDWYFFANSDRSRRLQRIKKRFRHKNWMVGVKFFQKEIYWENFD